MKNVLFILLILCSSVQVYAQEMSTIILVRHAEKGTSEDGDPDLTDEGKNRATRLAEMLTDQSIDHIYSTPFKRTQQTVEPLAQMKNITIEEYNPFEIDKTIELIQEHEGKTLLFSGHSNTVPVILNKLLETDKYKMIDESDYSNLFIVSFIELGDATVTHLKY